MSDRLEFRFECRDCGGTVIQLPDNHTDKSIVRCKACERPFGTYGDLKAKMRGMALAEVRKAAKRAFGKPGRRIGRAR